MGRIIVAGLGPGEIPVIDSRIWDFVSGVDEVVFRTEVHPGAASGRSEIASRNPAVKFSAFDSLYDRASSFELLYQEMAESLISLAGKSRGLILYLVPGSPLVGEKSVDLLRKLVPELVEIIPGVSFLELVWSALGIDPFGSGVTMIDAMDFPSLTKLHHGPYLLTQVWSKQILSDIKLAIPEPMEAKAVVLQRLGTASESIRELAWNDLDKVVKPDHLTTIYIEQIPAAPGPALIELYDIIARLRNECPWDKEQTHQSLAAHLIEESYEVVDAIDKLPTIETRENEEALFEEFKGELGDLLVQVYFHANLAMEESRFDLGDIAETVTRKLIRRHPHVFTELQVSGSEQVIANWEKIKQTQEGRTSVLEGIPQSLPTLLLVSKLLRKATAVGLDLPSAEDSANEISRVWQGLLSAMSIGRAGSSDEFGELLWWIANLSKQIGIDLESALRSRTREFIEAIQAAES